MFMLADIVLDPGGLVAWLVVGLIAGWAAGQVMKGSGFGLLGDIVVGLIGAFIGGFVFGSLQGTYALGSTGFRERWNDPVGLGHHGLVGRWRGRLAVAAVERVQGAELRPRPRRPPGQVRKQVAHPSHTRR